MSSIAGHHPLSPLDQSSITASRSPGIVLVIDRNMSTRAEALALLDVLAQTLRDPQLDPATPISLLMFGSTVVLARVGRLEGEGDMPFVLESDVLDRAVTGSNSSTEYRAHSLRASARLLNSRRVIRLF